ncbi:hypothetical protein ACIQAC_40595 [Streptomyces sp. NPDC088387]|uniref:hypothetical protein n=1 Tax=Streptomyces sp. NPDC088387 TaxID=3365859 RepID=UPI003820F222
MRTARLGTASYYFERVSMTIKDRCGAKAVPERPVLYWLERGQHATGRARTRRSLANLPEGVFD